MNRVAAWLLSTKIISWLFVGVPVSLIPIFFTLGDLYLVDQPWTLQTVLGDGELFLLAIGLPAVALGDVLYVVFHTVLTKKWPGRSQPGPFLLLLTFIMVLVCFIVVLAASYFYATAADAGVDAAAVTRLSLAYYAAGVVASTVCVYTTER
jgi:hypothetical protein